MSYAMKDEGKASSSAAAASDAPVVGSHDAFRKVDDLVAKPTYGSDGAAAWQTFRKDVASRDGRMMNKVKGTSSLGSAPLAPLKRLDRALQFRSWDDEVKYERALRRKEGQADMNSGYQLFHEKKKKKKQTEEEEEGPPGSSTDPEARDGSRKRGGVDHGGDEANHESVSKKKKKKLKAAPVPVPVVVDTPDHPLQQLAEAMQRRHQQHQLQPQQHPSPSLPAGWESAHDAASQKTYYFNRTLGQRQWTVPGVAEAPHAAVATSANASVPPPSGTAAGEGPGASPGKDADDNLPPGWVAVTDPATHKTYYYHQETRETRWDKPSTRASSAAARDHEADQEADKA